LSQAPSAAALAPVVRAAAPGDADRLAELYRAAEQELAELRGGRVLVGLQARPEPVEATFIEQLERPGHLVVVGALGEKVVGYGSCRTLSLAGGELLGSVEELFVLPEVRRNGVGKAISGALLDWCSSLACTGVDAKALPGSRAVKSFFETQGFTARVLFMHRPLA